MASYSVYSITKPTVASEKKCKQFRGGTPDTSEPRCSGIVIRIPSLSIHAPIPLQALFSSKVSPNGHRNSQQQLWIYKLPVQQPQQKENASFPQFQPESIGSDQPDLVYISTPEPITVTKGRYFLRGHTYMVFPPLKVGGGGRGGVVNLT